MPTFTYVAYTAEGKTRKGKKEGVDLKDIREQLLREGLYAREVKGVSESLGSRGVTAAVRSVMYRELSALLKAGLPLDQALNLLSENPELQGGKERVSVVRDQVREGVEFSKALSEHMPGVRGSEAAVLAAGESSGRLAEVTGELANTLDDESQLLEQVRSALLYPAIVTGLAVVVLGVLVGFLLPVYEKLLLGMDRELPALTRVTLMMGRGIRHPVGIGILLLIAMMLGRVVWKVRANPENVLARRRFALPVIGKLMGSLSRTRFARTLAMMLEGGVRLPEAIQVAGRATGSTFLIGHCQQMSEQVSQGERLAVALSRVPVLNEDLPGWVRAGEAAGDLAPLLRHAALSHQRAWSRGLDRALSLLEPLLILSVGVMILWVALAVLLPMLQLNQGLGG
jgi:general secretion pathway protein F